MHLDFGQRNFHEASKCPVCGLLYTKGQSEDEKLHSKFHSNATKGLRYPLPAAAFSSSSSSSSGGEGGDHIIARHPQSRSVTVTMDSIDVAKDKKVHELASFLEDQMGLVKGWLFAVPGFVFLEVSVEKRIIGCVVLERIRQGFPIITTNSMGSSGGAGNGKDNNNNNNKDRSQSLLEHNNKKTPHHHHNNDNYNSSTLVVLDRTRPQKASFGVRLLWVSVNYRRQGLAGRLLDTARIHCMPGYVAQRAALAFSQPTAEGRSFMERYTGRDNFLIYDAPP
jgi:N-acetyltransferase